MKVNPIATSHLPIGNKGNAASENMAESFKDMLNTALDKVNKVQTSADQAIQKFSTGQIEDIHQVMTAVEEANLALRLTIQIRNKILDSYREIMRMQV
jgi:flagellar hook-basal body complex protein FliE